MKSLRLLLTIVSVGALMLYSNCGGKKKTERPIQEVQLEKLSKTWKVTAVTLDGVDKTADYKTASSTFTLGITGTVGASSFAYTATGRPALSAWKSGGTWAFGTDPATQIVRDPDNAADKLDMTYSVTETTLQLTFTFNNANGGYPGRTEVVNGQWVFTFGL